MNGQVDEWMGWKGPANEWMMMEQCWYKADVMADVAQRISSQCWSSSDRSPSGSPTNNDLLTSDIPLVVGGSAHFLRKSSKMSCVGIWKLIGTPRAIATITPL